MSKRVYNATHLISCSKNISAVDSSVTLSPSEVDPDIADVVSQLRIIHPASIFIHFSLVGCVRIAQWNQVGSGKH